MLQRFVPATPTTLDSRQRLPNKLYCERRRARTGDADAVCRGGRVVKLVVFGLTMSSSWGNGHATLWRALAKGLAQLGHSLVFFERDVPYYRAYRDYTTLPNGRLALYRDWEQVRAEATAELKSADSGMITSYCPDAVDATQLLLDSPVPLRTFYDLDTPVTLSRLQAGERVDYLPADGLASFDLVLSFTGGAALRELQTRLGARETRPLYGGVDPESHQPVPPQPRFAADLSYLGTYSADRQNALSSLLLEPARRLPERRFLIGGSLYPSEFPWSNNLFYMPHVAPPDHPAFYCSSPLTVNVTRGPMVAMGWCPSGRLFEAAACGTPVLSDTWNGLEDFFEPGKEILLARSVDEAMDRMRRPATELRQIGAAARRRALSEHTGLVRARQLVEALTGTSRVLPNGTMVKANSEMTQCGE
jgi:spore maturation protein CgeB